MGDDWYVRLVDITVDPVYCPPTESGASIFWDESCDCWKDTETLADAEAVYSAEKQCWVNAEDETAVCIPLDHSAPKPIWDTSVNDWMDQYGSIIDE